ncbi:MipA/OmpV family protein [Apirhabdus apintestini]|nr:MipA/OmpV family protein [Enterobacteriaceae bacterium CA-0114]
MTKFKLLALAAVAAAAVNTAYAEGSWSLGAAAYMENYPYRGINTKTSPVPVVGYVGKDFYFRGFSAGYYLWNDKTDKLAVTAWYNPLHMRPKDSGDHAMRRLDYRRSTMMAGLSYAHFTQYGFLRTALGGDVLGESNGVIWDLGWLYSYSAGGLTITPGIGAVWSSENQNRYYYGVSSHEAARSGMDRYKADSDWNPYVELSVNYKLDKSWSIYGMGRYIRLGDEVKDSPMVDRTWTGVLLTGVNYSF